MGLLIALQIPDCITKPWKIAIKNRRIAKLIKTIAKLISASLSVTCLRKLINNGNKFCQMNNGEGYAESARQIAHLGLWFPISNVI